MLLWDAGGGREAACAWRRRARGSAHHASRSVCSGGPGVPGRADPRYRRGAATAWRVAVGAREVACHDGAVDRDGGSLLEPAGQGYGREAACPGQGGAAAGGPKTEAEG